MKSLLFFTVIMYLLGGCSAKHNPNGSYERANSASQKAHQRLDREF